MGGIKQLTKLDKRTTLYNRPTPGLEVHEHLILSYDQTSTSSIFSSWVEDVRPWVLDDPESSFRALCRPTLVFPIFGATRWRDKGQNRNESQIRSSLCHVIWSSFFNSHHFATACGLQCSDVTPKASSKINLPAILSRTGERFSIQRVIRLSNSFRLSTWVIRWAVHWNYDRNQWIWCMNQVMSVTWFDRLNKYKTKVLCPHCVPFFVSFFLLQLVISVYRVHFQDVLLILMM